MVFDNSNPLLLEKGDIIEIELCYIVKVKLWGYCSSEVREMCHFEGITRFAFYIALGLQWNILFNEMAFGITSF